VESGATAPRPVGSLTEPGRLTSYLLITGAAVLMLLELATALSVEHPGKVGTATWVVLEAPGLALMAAFTGASVSAGGAWWARRQEKASGTTIRSIGYGIGAAAIAGSVIAVLAWASINPEVAGKVALASFAAAVGGGVLGSVRVGGAVLGGLVAALVSILIATGGGLVLSWTLVDADPDPAELSKHLSTLLVAGSVVRGVAVLVGTVVGCRWLARRRRDTGIGYYLLVGMFGALLQIVSAPIAFLAALPVAQNLDAGIHPLRALASQQGVSILVSLGVGMLTGTVLYVARRIGRRSVVSRAVPEPATQS
jgi:hypothetical protein